MSGCLHGMHKGNFVLIYAFKGVANNFLPITDTRPRSLLRAEVVLVKLKTLQSE
jgi:hypothetical protein